MIGTQPNYHPEIMTEASIALICRVCAQYRATHSQDQC
jgi:hypothetical protein